MPTPSFVTEPENYRVQKRAIGDVLSLISNGRHPEVDKNLKRAWSNYKRTKQSQWLNDDNVRGFGLARKVTRRRTQDEYALKVYVDRKKPVEDVQHLVDPYLSLADAIPGIRTDVVECGRARLDTPNIAFIRQPGAEAYPGYSTAECDSGAGTFGCIVADDFDDLYILSNSHILANCGLTLPGADVYYPAKSDMQDMGVTPDNRDIVGRLADFIPVDPSRNDNDADAAIAAVSPAMVESFVEGIDTVPRGTNADVFLGMPIQIFGRQSGHQLGSVKDISAIVIVDGWKIGNGTVSVTFAHQIQCTKYAQHGDSGSAVFDMRGNVVGLHFASDDRFSYFSRIDRITTKLKVRVVTRDV